MAYDVIKTINGRAYRYRVQSVRDPASGRSRNAWTYVGRVASERGPAAPKKARSDTRTRLLDALERLLERGDLETLTAGAVAAEAGFAHGTFYRYFRDKAAAVHAVMERIRALRVPDEQMLRDDVMTVTEARAALRAWAESLLRAPAERPGSLRAWFALVMHDPELKALRHERKLAVQRLLARHLTLLARRGLARVADPGATASALFAMLDGFYRETIVDGEALDAQRIAGALDVVERAVF